MLPLSTFGEIQRHTCREAFTELDEDSRIGVLEAPLNEIVRMLEQNLLSKFKKKIVVERGALDGEAAFLPLLWLCNVH